MNAMCTIKQLLKAGTHSRKKHTGKERKEIFSCPGAWVHSFQTKRTGKEQNKK